MYYEVKKILMEKTTPKIGRQYRVQYTNPVYEPQWLKTSDLHKANHTIRDWNAVKIKLEVSATFLRIDFCHYFLETFHFL